MHRPQSCSPLCRERANSRHARRCVAARLGWRRGRCPLLIIETARKTHPGGRPCARTISYAWLGSASGPLDRKSVVSGKSESVSGGLGGRRIFKKKNKANRRI